MPRSDYLWRWYQTRVAQLFMRVRGAKVEEDVYELGVNSRKKRQIDVRIVIPLKLNLREFFTVLVPIKLIVDCKHYKRRLDVKSVETIAGLKDDVQAQLAIAVSPLGVSNGARNRAPSLGVYPLTITNDLFALLDGLNSEVSCLACERPHYVGWDRGVGACTYCGTLHVGCRDCLAVFAIPEPDDGPVACPEECGAVFVASYDPREGDFHVQGYDMLETCLLRAAYRKSTKRLTRGEVSRVVASTRWQYWTVDRPTIRLEEERLMQWKGDCLCLTEDGAQVVEDILLKAEPALWY